MREGIFKDLHGSYSVIWRSSTVSCKPAGAPLMSRYGDIQGVDGATPSSQRLQHQGLAQDSSPALLLAASLGRVALFDSLSLFFSFLGLSFLTFLTVPARCLGHSKPSLGTSDLHHAFWRGFP